MKTIIILVILLISSIAHAQSFPISNEGHTTFEVLPDSNAKPGTYRSQYLLLGIMKTGASIYASFTGIEEDQRVSLPPLKNTKGDVIVLKYDQDTVLLSDQNKQFLWVRGCSKWSITDKP